MIVAKPHHVFATRRGLETDVVQTLTTLGLDPRDYDIGSIFDDIADYDPSYADPAAAGWRYRLTLGDTGFHQAVRRHALWALIDDMHPHAVWERSTLRSELGGAFPESTPLVKHVADFHIVDGYWDQLGLIAETQALIVTTPDGFVAQAATTGGHGPYSLWRIYGGPLWDG